MEITWTGAGVIVAALGIVVAVWNIRRGDLQRIDERLHRVEEFRAEAAQRYATLEMIHRIEDGVLSAVSALAERFDRFIIEWRNAP